MATINEILRDNVRFTGDGLPDEPVGYPLPVGYPPSGNHVITKEILRDLANLLVVGSGADVIYETTPTITFGGNDVGVTYDRQICTILRTGRRISFHLSFSLDSKGTSTGAARIDLGLPNPIDTSAVSLADVRGFLDAPQGAAVFTNGDIILKKWSNETSKNLATTLTESDFGNKSSVILSGTYIAEA